MDVVDVEPRNWKLGDEHESRQAVIGSFTIPPNSLIGEGGNGFVYIATHPNLGSVAIKIDKHKLSKLSLPFMQQEVRAHDILSRSPNCSKFVTCLLGAMAVNLVDPADSNLYHAHGVLVIERMDGDVYSMIRNTRRMQTSPTHILELCFYIHLNMIAQVKYIHSRGLVHGDVKPQNVLYKRDPVTRILEFRMSDLGTACNPVRDCRNRYGGTLFYRTRAFARCSDAKVMDPPSKMRVQNDLYGCCLSLPVMLFAAGLLQKGSDKWTDLDRIRLIQNFGSYRTGDPIVDAGIIAIHSALDNEEYTPSTKKAAFAAFLRLKATAVQPGIATANQTQAPQAKSLSRSVTAIIDRATGYESPTVSLPEGKSLSKSVTGYKSQESTSKRKRALPSSTVVLPPPPKRRVIGTYDSYSKSAKTVNTWSYHTTK